MAKKNILGGILDLFRPKKDPVTNLPSTKQGVQFGPTQREATDTLFDQGMKQQQELRSYTMFDEASDTLNKLGTSLEAMRAGEATQPFTIARKTMDMLRESALTRYIQNTDFKKYGYEGYLPRGEYRDKFANQLKIAFKDIAPNENVDEFLELVRKWQTNTIGSAEIAKKFPTLMEKGGAQGLGFRSVGEALQEDLFMGELSLMGTLKNMGAKESKNITEKIQVVTPEQKVIKKAGNIEKFIDEAVQGTEFTPNQIKEAIVENYNAGYQAGDPKRITIGDDDAIERLVDINTNYGKTDRQNYIKDIIEEAYEIQINKGKKANPADELKRLEGIQALENLDTKNRKPNAFGGRVGLSLGGVGKGIMEAVQLAKKGIKPFGEKQTYNQNVKNMGLSNFDAVEVVTSQKIDKLRNANDVDGLFEMLEDIVSGKKFGMANPTQRKVLQENIEEALNDIPLNRDSRERLSEDYFNMMEYYKPEPEETGKVIPFKPKEEKAMGGRIGAYKGLFMSEAVQKFLKNLGMDAPDKVADQRQIKNVIADEATDLERTKSTPKNKMTIEDIRDMVQKDPRYNKLTEAEMDKVIVKETIRADLAYNMNLSPKEAEKISDQFIEEMYQSKYQNKFGMANGGGVGTLFKRRTS